MAQFLEMPATAVKGGKPYEKDGKKHCYDTVTFIMPDGDSFKLTCDREYLPVKNGDICIFGIRNVMTAEGRPAVALSIASARPAKLG
ncbi:MAG: hypothetical protein RR675_03810 [Oscillospiraceae bacterium]